MKICNNSFEGRHRAYIIFIIGPASRINETGWSKRQIKRMEEYMKAHPTPPTDYIEDFTTPMPSMIFKVYCNKKGEKVRDPFVVGGFAKKKLSKAVAIGLVKSLSLGFDKTVSTRSMVKKDLASGVFVDYIPGQLKLW